MSGIALWSIKRVCGIEVDAIAKPGCKDCIERREFEESEPKVSPELAHLAG
jgi:hypothetical protein